MDCSADHASQGRPGNSISVLGGCGAPPRKDGCGIVKEDMAILRRDMGGYGAGLEVVAVDILKYTYVAYLIAPTATVQ